MRRRHSPPFFPISYWGAHTDPLLQPGMQRDSWWTSPPEAGP